MSQGEEEGPECDVVQPTREQTEMGTGGLLVQCRGQATVRSPPPPSQSRLGPKKDSSAPLHQFTLYESKTEGFKG